MHQKVVKYYRNIQKGRGAGSVYVCVCRGHPFKYDGSNLTQMMTFHLEGHKGTTHENIGEEYFWQRKEQVLEAGSHLVCSNNSNQSRGWSGAGKGENGRRCG